MSEHDIADGYLIVTPRHYLRRGRIVPPSGNRLIFAEMTEE